MKVSLTPTFMYIIYISSAFMIQFIRSLITDHDVIRSFLMELSSRESNDSALSTFIVLRSMCDDKGLRYPNHLHLLVQNIREDRLVLRG